MIATNFSNVRNNFKEVCDRVVHDSDIAIIKGSNFIQKQKTVYSYIE